MSDEKLKELLADLSENYAVSVPVPAAAASATVDDATPKPRLNRDGSVFAEDLDLVFDFDRVSREQGFFESASADGSLARATAARTARAAAAEAAEKKAGAKAELERRLAESDQRVVDSAKAAVEREQARQKAQDAMWAKSGGSRIP